MNFNRKKAIEACREDVIMNLPFFINEILLLINSGVTLNDALYKTAESYEGDSGFFRSEISKIARSSKRNGENMLTGFYIFARNVNVKELTRVAGFLLENRNRGTDMWDKLEEIAEGLWEERKRLCMKKIKLAETKMSFPLGIMLLSLIIMTSAPAMLKIN